jgi:hypothetical protein
MKANSGPRDVAASLYEVRSLTAIWFPIISVTHKEKSSVFDNLTA